jgi:hypothetical protein
MRHLQCSEFELSSIVTLERPVIVDKLTPKNANAHIKQLLRAQYHYIECRDRFQLFV